MGSDSDGTDTLQCWECWHGDLKPKPSECPMRYEMPDIRPVDFCPDDGQPWARSQPTEAIIISDDKCKARFVVQLPDGGETHLVILMNDDGQYWGTCDCMGFNHGFVCAHIVTVRKAEFIGEVCVPLTRDSLGTKYGDSA